jgi:transcriptional regulator
MTTERPEPSGTLRENVRRALLEGELSVRELSQRLGASEREVVDALPHVARSVEAAGDVFVTLPAECAGCGFVFAKRARAGKPSRCPECRATRVRPPRFRVMRGAP